MTQKETGPKVVTILQIQRSLEDIADDPCFVCNGTTTKVLLEYEQPYTEKRMPAVAMGSVPGYSCNDCDTEFFDFRSSIEALKATRDLLSEVDDINTLQQIKASLKAVSS